MLKTWIASPKETPTTDEPVISLPLQELIERLPKEPGVYLMKDKKGRIIYVGKATNLRQRVRSYFNRSGDSRGFVRLLNRLLGSILEIHTQLADSFLNHQARIAQVAQPLLRGF